MPRCVVDAVRTRRAFSALRHSRNRARSGPVWIVRADAPSDLPEAAGAPVRVAYAVGRPVGTAVARNRVRRRLRPMIDELAGAGTMRPGVYLVGATAAAAGEDHDGLRRHLIRAVEGVA